MGGHKRAIKNTEYPEMSAGIRVLFLSGLLMGGIVASNVAMDKRGPVVKPFVEGDIRVVSPIRRAKSKEGLFVERRYNDGGTTMIRIVDALGKAFDVYVDRRLTRETEWGTIYLNGYPGSRGAIRILKQGQFKDRIMTQLGAARNE